VTVSLVVLINVGSITTVPLVEAFLGVLVTVDCCLVLPPFTSVELVSVNKFVEAWLFVGLVYLIIA